MQYGIAHLKQMYLFLLRQFHSKMIISMSKCCFTMWWWTEPRFLIMFCMLCVNSWLKHIESAGFFHRTFLYSFIPYQTSGLVHSSSFDSMDDFTAYNYSHLLLHLSSCASGKIGIGSLHSCWMLFRPSLVWTSVRVSELECKL